MGASAAIIIIIAMFFIGLFITIPSLIGLITYKLHNKKKGKKTQINHSYNINYYTYIWINSIFSSNTFCWYTCI